MSPSRCSSFTIIPAHKKKGPGHGDKLEVSGEWVSMRTLLDASGSADVGDKAISSDSRLPNDHDDSDDAPSLNIGARFSTSTSNSNPSSFPIPSTEHRFPLDNARQHQLGLIIQREGGDKRFPKLSPHVVEHAKKFDDGFQEIHPGEFLANNFAHMWTLNCHQFSTATITEEEKYRGVVYRVQVKRSQFNGPIQRGSSFIIKDLFSQDIRYFATIRRGMNQYGTSFVQLNAYSKEQDLLLVTCPYWPTLLLEVPNTLCCVPMPKVLYQYHTTIVAPPPTFFTRCLTKAAHDFFGNRGYLRYPELWSVEFI